MDEHISKFLNGIKYNSDLILEEMELTNIVLSKIRKEANVSFSSFKPIPVEEMKRFNDYLDNLKAFNVNKFIYDYKFSSYKDEDVVSYFKYVIQRVASFNISLIKSIDYEITYKNSILFIKVPSSDDNFSQNKTLITDEYQKLGFDGISIQVEYFNIEEDKIIEQIQTETLDIIETAKHQLKKEEEHTFNTYKPEKDFYGSPIALKELPDNEADYNDFKVQNNRSFNFIIKGYVKFKDDDLLEERNIVKFVLSDDEEDINSYVYCTRRKLSTNQEYKYFKGLKVGMFCEIQCYPELNNFTKEVTMAIVNIRYSNEIKPITYRMDTYEKKRIELHLHTKMSSLDGVPDMNQYIEAAELFGQKGIAITDHGSVQSFHDLYEYAEKHQDFKPLYGVELSYVDDDNVRIAYEPQDINLKDATYTVFDFETTGLTILYEKIIEVSAVKVRNGMIIDSFTSLVNPEKDIHPSVIKLTGITNNDVAKARKRSEVISEFFEFIKGTILVAHNADFDLGHLYAALDEMNVSYTKFPAIDTLTMIKAMVPGRRSYGLDGLCKIYGVRLDNHHRALDDATATAECFIQMLNDVYKLNITNHKDLNSLITPENVFTIPFPTHINLIAKTQEGLINLYHLLSIASTDTFFREPTVLKSTIEKYREGILVGSGCRNSYFFDIALRKRDKDIEDIIDFYDYIEVQPSNSFEYYHNHMFDHLFVYRDTVKRIIKIARRHNIPVCATGDCHQINPEDLIYREILVATPLVGGGSHKLKNDLKENKEIPAEYFMTTDEMMDEFQFLGKELSEEIVITNTNKIADSCDFVKSFSKTPYPPKDDFLKDRGIPSAEGYVQKTVDERVKSLYGDPLPEIVKSRVDNELDNIMKNKFSTIYLISQQLVYKSRSDGYVVGSRGSVGSSFVANLMDITEVNSLPPHYRCPKCKFSTFKMTKEEKEKYGIRKEERELNKVLDTVLSGFDLPDRNCPICGTLLDRDGQDIPFETFLGVPSDPKTPDIDLNFSGLNQGDIHNYIRELFGYDKAFRAGTILTCQSKTAYAVVNDVFKDRNKELEDAGHTPINYKKPYIEALSNQINGSKKSSSQHPGGIVVVPVDHEVYEVTPYQYPGDCKDRSWRTTHFDYHSFEKNLFKLDVLGHDDPTVIKYLMDYVHARQSEFPFDDALKIPVNDQRLYQMMNGTEIIGVKPEEIDSTVATYGISEFGTPFVRGLLEEARPKTFAGLVKVSGLSHGTDVWRGNAEELLLGRAKNMPKIEFENVIGCRDDIMVDLISFGVPSPLAFKIMEFVRKGKAPKEEEKWAQFVTELRQYNVPEWYIWSCGKIKYMFPKAHATAYIVMALRIAWFKLYRPIYFYSAILSKKMVQYNVEVMVGGYARIKSELERLKALKDDERKPKENDLITTYELSLEMTARGLTFLNVDLYNSDAEDFRVTEDGKSLYMPFTAVDQLGSECAKSIVEARKEKPFANKNDFMQRTKTSKTIFQSLDALDVFHGLENDAQLSLNLEF